LGVCFEVCSLINETEQVEDLKLGRVVLGWKEEKEGEGQIQKEMLAPKQVAKSSRVFLSSLFLFNLKNNNPLISTTSPSLYCCFYYDYSTAVAAAAAAAAARGGGTRDRVTSAKDIATSFKEWFKKGNNELLNRIFVTIQKHGEDKEALGLALSQLRLPLNESFVLDVLAYGKNRNEIYSCVKFFDWAGHKGGFFHTRVTFHAFFKILTESKGMSVMLDFLEVCKGTGDVYVHHNMRFQTVLVMGYAVAGKPDVALQMLGRMRFQGLDLDTFSYHVLLNSLIEGFFF
jgi:pentatricopeptide repeat protein